MYVWKWKWFGVVIGRLHYGFGMCLETANWYRLMILVYMLSSKALEKERMATIRQLEQTGKELSEELNRTKMELHERRETVLHGRREMKDSGIQISGEFMTTAVVELEHANRQIRDLNLEKEKLLREKDNAALDQEHFRMLMLELEETKAKLEEISLLKENLSSANDMIDFQASELERVKKELAEFTKGGDTPLGQAGENLADELGNALQKLPVLSLEDEIGQACEVSHHDLVSQITYVIVIPAAYRVPSGLTMRVKRRWRN